jgi:hypothetical protein
MSERPRDLANNFKPLSGQVNKVFLEAGVL